MTRTSVQTDSSSLHTFKMKCKLQLSQQVYLWIDHTCTCATANNCSDSLPVPLPHPSPSYKHNTYRRCLWRHHSLSCSVCTPAVQRIFPVDWAVPPCSPLPRPSLRCARVTCGEHCWPRRLSRSEHCESRLPLSLDFGWFLNHGLYIYSERYKAKP